MNPRRLLAALLMALVGSGLFTLWLSKRFSHPAAAPAAPKQQYVAAIKNLEPGDTLQKPMLKLVDWPSASPLEGAFAKPEDVVGRTVLYPLSGNAPILDRQLALAGSGAGLSQKIPDGMRAISLRTDLVVGVAGFLLPGSHVDVLVTYRTPDSPAQETSMVMQDAEVIAAGQKMQPDPEGKPTTVDVVTLLANPQDAERIVLASAQGTIHFVMRNGSDHVHVDSESAQLDELGGAKHVVKLKSVVHKVDASALAAGKPYGVQTVAGDKKTLELFQ